MRTLIWKEVKIVLNLFLLRLRKQQFFPARGPHWKYGALLLAEMGDNTGDFPSGHCYSVYVRAPSISGCRDPWSGPDSCHGQALVAADTGASEAVNGAGPL